MIPHFCISISFLDPLFHGNGDGDIPEWPPSPFRLFQAMLAGARAGYHNRTWSIKKAKAFQWLEKCDPPQIIAPRAQRSSACFYYVPNNDSDKKFDRQERLTTKIFQPHRLLASDQPKIHYLWSLSDDFNQEIEGYIEILSEISRNILALGWGIDVVFGNGSIISEEKVDTLDGEKWFPVFNETNEGFRVPVPGTLTNLELRHARFLKRFESVEFVQQPPLSRYVEYRRAIDPLRRPFAAFSLLKPDADGFRAFNTARQSLTVSGMVRHAAKLAAEKSGWPEPSFILGHGEAKESGSHIAVGPRRFAYIPLPSIENRGEGKTQVVGHVRRVIVTSFSDDCKAEIDWARKALSGQELLEKDEKQAVALLSLIPSTEKMVQHYTRSASTWATVTPIVLPGYDDPAHYRRRLKNGTGAEE